ncbi:MAG: DUF892 family protein [Cyclobacteriaceae bacterium]|nr:DUF892 family protein [Cyclobacteriaceae bacterium]
MKQLNNLNEILAYHLEAAYVAEKKIQKVLPASLPAIGHKKLAATFKKYLESSSDKRMKLKRMFGYLLVRPQSRKCKPVVGILDQMTAIVRSESACELRDVQLLGALLSLTRYKSSLYITAKLYSSALELNTVSALVNEVAGWENETYETLLKISSEGILQEAGEVGVA